MEPIKIEVTLKADQSLLDVVVLLGQYLVGLQKGRVESRKKASPVSVPPEGEIPGKPVVKEEPKADEDPFKGADEENSVDLSDMEESKTEEKAKTVTHEDARAAIKKARDREIGATQVKAIIAGMGFDVLDSIPVDRLPEFIAKVEAL